MGLRSCFDVKGEEMTELGSLDEKLKGMQKTAAHPGAILPCLSASSSSHTSHKRRLRPLQFLQFMGPRRESGVSSPVSSRDSACLTQLVTRTGFDGLKISDSTLCALASYIQFLGLILYKV